MGKFRRIVVFGAVLSLSGCGPDAAQHQQLQKRAQELEARVRTLEAEIEDLRYGASRLLSEARASAAAGRNDEAKVKLEELLKRHPGSAEALEAGSLMRDVEARIRVAEEQRKKEELARKRESERALAVALKNMKKQTDEIEGITWITHKRTPVLDKYVTLYFATRGGRADHFPLRMKVQYYADDWLFFDALTIKADEQTFELRSLDPKRDNSSGSIWEWTDVAVDDYKMLNAMMDAKRVLVRFHGSTYYSDFVLPRSQQIAMREVYTAWTHLGGSPN